MLPVSIVVRLLKRHEQMCFPTFFLNWRCGSPCEFVTMASSSHHLSCKGSLCPLMFDGCLPPESLGHLGAVGPDQGGFPAVPAPNRPATGAPGTCLHDHKSYLLLFALV